MLILVCFSNKSNTGLTLFAMRYLKICTAKALMGTKDPYESQKRPVSETTFAVCKINYLRTTVFSDAKQICLYPLNLRGSKQASSMPT